MPTENDPFSDYSDFDDDVGLGDEGKALFKPRQERFKMDKGQHARAALVYFHTYDITTVQAARKANPNMDREQMRKVGQEALEARAKELGKPVDQLTDGEKLDTRMNQFKKWMGHYHQGIGYIISRLGKDGKDADEIWKKITEPRLYFSTALLVYPTNREGDIIKEHLADSWKVWPWRFGKNIYERFWKLNASLKELGQGLATQDLKLECKDAQYQNIDVTFAGAALWQKSDKFKSLILDAALKVYPNLVDFREMSTEQLRAKLGLGGSAVADVGAGGDFAELLENV